MQEPLDRLRALKNELENTSFLNWDTVDIWGKKALPTIAKNWSEHLDEFKSLLKKPIYPWGARSGGSRPDPDSPIYIFSPERYQKDQEKWLESERRNEQQSKSEVAGYRQNCENSHKKILAFLDGIIHETENSVAMPATITHVSDYVNIQRIDELRCVNGTSYDLSKLVRMCEEINICYSSDAYFATLMLVRSILDHISPIFKCKAFSEIANNYNGGKSFKEAMQRLENTSRKIADSYLHSHIRNSESLPNSTQVKFDSELDFLLAEIYRILK
jgi:hypothetical protein